MIICTGASSPSSRGIEAIIPENPGWIQNKLYYETPRINQLAKEGAMFTQFYACSVCAPTRESLMTGKMHNRMGMWDAYARVQTTYEKSGKPVPPGGHMLDHEPWEEYNYGKTDRGVSIPVAATALHDVKTIPQGLNGYHSAFMGKWHIGSQYHKKLLRA